MPETKQLNLAPFTGLHHETNAIVERLFRDIFDSGSWTGEHEDMLAAWRRARGDDAKDAWWWWAGDVEGEGVDHDAATRDEVIAIGCREFAEDGGFIVMEARLWRDSVKANGDGEPFAEIRVREEVLIAGVDLDAA